MSTPHPSIHSGTQPSATTPVASNAGTKQTAKAPQPSASQGSSYNYLSLANILTVRLYPGPSVSAAGSKRIITTTEKGAEEGSPSHAWLDLIILTAILAASRAAKRENYEKYQRRVKRKTEAEERGNAAQPAPLPPEQKRMQVTLKKPEDILGNCLCPTRPITYLTYLHSLSIRPAAY
jgi:hypothetical protein